MIAQSRQPFCLIVRLILFSMVCFTFMVLVSALFLLIRSLMVSRTALAAENGDRKNWGLRIIRTCPSSKPDSSAFSTTSLVFLPTKIFEIKI